MFMFYEEKKQENISIIVLRATPYNWMRVQPTLLGLGNTKKMNPLNDNLEYVTTGG